MSLLKIVARTMSRIAVCWCLLLGVNAVLIIPEALPKLGWCFFYSFLAGINWSFSDSIIV